VNEQRRIEALNFYYDKGHGLCAHIVVGEA